MKKNKITSLMIILAIYFIAAIAGYTIYINLPFEFYFNLLIADISSTILIFIFSCIFKNASCYDAYWSVAPIVIISFYLISKPFNIVRLLLSIAIIGWGIRLTINWAYTFDNLLWMDWRYKMLKEKTKWLYPLVNFLGIHLFPTLVVYTCILPAVFCFEYETSFNILVLLFFLLSMFSFQFQAVADIQMHRFRKTGSNTFIRNGLWKYSRHPNYLGEIMMWISIGLLSISALNGYYFLIIGSFINTLMFVFISIPMAEEHQRSRKEGFDEYKKETRMLLPIYKKID